MYRPYRGGRAQRRRRILNLILVLLALLVIGGTVFLLFFQEHLVYSSDGVRFELPWSKPAAQDQSPAPSTDESAQPADDAGQSGGTATAMPDTAKQKPVLAVSDIPKLLEIPADKLGDAAYLAQVKKLHAQGAINGATIVVKDPAGALIWKSAVTGVQNTAILSGAGDALPSAVQTLQADGLSVTAVLFAYEDDLYAAQDSTAALKRAGTGNAWRSKDNTRRLDPSSDAANTYLTALVQELSEMGCNEVVLRGFGWPAEGTGRLDRVSYGDYRDAASRSDKLIEVLSALKAAAGDMEISVCVDDPAAENGVNEGSGQDLGALSQVAARVFVPMVVQTATSGDSIRTIIGRVSGADVSRLVPIYSSKELAKDLFANSRAMYFSPSETNGDLTAYLKQ